MTVEIKRDVDFEFDVSLDDVDDLPGLLHTMRSTHPAAWVRMLGAPVLLFTSYDLVAKAFADEATFPAAAMYGQSFYTEVMGKTVQTLSGAEHRIRRGLVAPAFRPSQMNELNTTVIEPLVHELLDAVDPTAEIDLVSRFTSRLPLRVILRLLGIPLAEEHTFRSWANGLLDFADQGRVRQCAREFIAYVKPVLEERRHCPADDLLSELATSEFEGERLSDGEIYAFISLLFPAGADTTYLNLGSTLLALFNDEQQMDLLKSDPVRNARRAAEEGLRWEPASTYLPRRNLHETMWNGVHIPAGAGIMLSALAANRDPETFSDPDRFDLQRDTAGLMTFGTGVHFCLGKHLAIAEMETALRVLAQRFPNARLADCDGVRIVGTSLQVLRGPNQLPVRLT